jgi:hypothetical protein
LSCRIYRVHASRVVVVRDLPGSTSGARAMPRSRTCTTS